MGKYILSINNYISFVDGEKGGSMTDVQISRLENLFFDLNEPDPDGVTMLEKFNELNINIDNFSDDQIQSIECGLDKMTVEKVSMYANSNLSTAQMYQIYSGFVDGLDADAVSAIADLDFTASEMGSMRISLKYGLDPDGLKDNLRKGEEKLCSFLNGDTKINEISVWETTNHRTMSSPHHSEIMTFEDTSYFCATDDGNFEVSVEWDDCFPYQIVVFYDINSNDDTNDGNHILIYYSEYNFDTAYDILEKVYNLIKYDEVDADKHVLEIADKYIGDDEAGEPQFLYSYTIDGAKMIESDHPAGEYYNSTARFCEKHIDLVRSMAAAGTLFKSPEAFRETIESAANIKA